MRIDVQAPGRLTRAMDDESEYQQSDGNDERQALQAHTQLSPIHGTVVGVT